MTTRRNVVLGLGGLALAGGGYVTGAFREKRVQTDSRLFGQGAVIAARAGALEYAVAGDGPPLMMIHGTGGGFDQGLLFAAGLRRRGFRIIAPSRFGYLGSSFPGDASPAHQADTLVDLLDHLGIESLLVLGGSAGALTAAEFAARHPGRCSHLGLLVPAANLTNRDPVEFTALQSLAVGVVLGSDFRFWSLARLAPRQMIRTLLATDPALLDRVPEVEHRRAMTILNQIFPIGRKVDGLRTDGFWAGTPSPTAYDRITVPTLIVSCEDDLFGTAATARLLAGRIPNAEITIYPTGGHIWLGHDEDVAERIAGFVRGTTIAPVAEQGQRMMIMIWAAVAVSVLAVGLGLLMWTTSLPRAFETQKAKAVAVPREDASLLTEADIAHLPPPVRRYVALTGSIGRPVVTEITLRFEATMLDAPGAPGMTGPVAQYERFDLPRRLFLMTTRMKGLPVAVLHDFNSDQATMRVRLARLVNVVNIGGPELTRTETVTILNDLCFFAPSRLIDPRLTWTPIGDTRARVSFALGPNTVSAELIFNEVGDLVDFVSEDRGMLEKNGTLRILRWTTPMSNCRDFSGWRVASEGDAIWHLPEGPFTYGHMRLTHYEAR